MSLANVGTAIAIGLGVVGFVQTNWDRLGKRAKRHIPAETHEILLRILKLALQMEREIKSPEWVSEFALPLWQDWQPVEHLIITAKRRDFWHYGQVGLNLYKLTLSVFPDGSPRSPEWVTEAQGEQITAAHTLTDATRLVLHLQAGVRDPDYLLTKSGDLTPIRRRWWRRKKRYKSS